MATERPCADGSGGTELHVLWRAAGSTVAPSCSDHSHRGQWPISQAATRRNVAFRALPRRTARPSAAAERAAAPPQHAAALAHTRRHHSPLQIGSWPLEARSGWRVWCGRGSHTHGGRAACRQATMGVARAPCMRGREKRSRVVSPEPVCAHGLLPIGRAVPLLARGGARAKGPSPSRLIWLQEGFAKERRQCVGFYFSRFLNQRIRDC